jgi:hypothetical protein
MQADFVWLQIEIRIDCGNEVSEHVECRVHGWSVAVRESAARYRHDDSRVDRMMMSGEEVCLVRPGMDVAARAPT